MVRINFPEKLEDLPPNRGHVAIMADVTSGTWSDREEAVIATS